MPNLANTVYLLQARGTWQGQDIIHTLHFLRITPDVVSEAAAAQALIDQWQAAAQSAWLAIYPSTYTLTDITAQRICGTVPLPAATIESVATAGTRAGTGTDQAAPWLACLVRERTGLAGKEYAGRFFVAGLQELDIVSQTIQTAYMTLVNAYVTALGTFLVGGANTEWDLFVYSRKLAAVPGTQCQNAGAGVTSVAASNILTTQKSRRSRTGA